MQSNQGMRVIHDFHLPRLGRLYGDAEFLGQFPAQGLLDRFPRLEFPARELPITRIGLAHGP